MVLAPVEPETQQKARRTEAQVLLSEEAGACYKPQGPAILSTSDQGALATRVHIPWEPLCWPSLCPSITLAPGLPAPQRPLFCPLVGSLCKSPEDFSQRLTQCSGAPSVSVPSKETLSFLWLLFLQSQPCVSWCGLCRSRRVLGHPFPSTHPLRLSEPKLIPQG